MASGYEYSVVTPERVSLEYGIAGIGSRCAAVAVDTLIQAFTIGIVALAALAALVVLGPYLRSSGDPVGVFALLVGLLALCVFAVTSGYFMLFEILWNGQTPGKRLVGLRVIRENGYPLRPMDAVIRELVRIVDFLPGLYAAGVLTMLLNKRSRRLGDFAAGTIVVREGSRRPLSSVSLASVSSSPASSWPISSAPVSPSAVADESPGVTLGSADATLIRDFLLRRASMHPKARAALARRLAIAVSQRYQLPLVESLDPERFLERLTV